MAQLSVSAAARAVGKDRGTIHRYIKSGKLSTAKDVSGNTVVETAELLRVFGALKGDGGRPAVAQPVAPAVENSSMQHVLEVTLELLKGQLKASQDREEKLLDMLRQEQQARWSLERRLLPPGTERDPEQAETANGPKDPPQAPQTPLAETVVIQAEAVTPRPSPPPGTGPEAEKKGLLARLFGG